MPLIRLPCVTLGHYQILSIFLNPLLTALDMLEGFNQIAVAEDSIPKLTIATPFGNWSYRVTPFGIQNGPHQVFFTDWYGASRARSGT